MDKEFLNINFENDPDDEPEDIEGNIDPSLIFNFDPDKIKEVPLIDYNISPPDDIDEKMIVDVGNFISEISNKYEPTNQESKPTTSLEGVLMVFLKEAIREVVVEENQKLLQEIKKLLKNGTT